LCSEIGRRQAMGIRDWRRFRRVVEETANGSRRLAES
jgi:hypothetical protein